MHKEQEQEQEPDFAAFVGIDWSDKKHDICIRVPGQANPERAVIEHRPEAIQAWAEKLRTRFGGAPVAISVELQEGPIVWALLEQELGPLALRLQQVSPTDLRRVGWANRPTVLMG